MASVYVIDDDTAILGLCESYASLCGFSSHIAADWESVDTNALLTVDVVLLDLEMPDVDGIDLIAILSELHCKATIILCTGHDGSVVNTAADIIKSHGLHYGGKLIKPFSFADFKLSVSRVLDQQPNQLSPEIGHASEELHQIDIAEALDNGWLTLHYQPQIDLLTNELCGLEALARLNHPEFGLVMPGSFLPLVSEQNMDARFTMAVYKTVLEDITRYQFDSAILVSFNLDRRLLNTAFFRELLPLAAEYGVDHRQLVIEITELSAMNMSVDTKSTLTKLRLAGFNLSLDDFGTGYATISELNELPFNEIKIDRRFIADMDKKDSSLAIIKSTIGLAQELKFRLVAEGIEDQVQINTLKALGCYHVQGYYLCKPRPLEQLIPEFLPVVTEL